MYLDYKASRTLLTCFRLFFGAVHASLLVYFVLGYRDASITLNGKLLLIRFPFQAILSMLLLYVVTKFIFQNLDYTIEGFDISRNKLSRLEKIT